MTKFFNFSKRRNKAWNQSFVDFFEKILKKIKIKADQVSEENKKAIQEKKEKKKFLFYLRNFYENKLFFPIFLKSQNSNFQGSQK